MKTIAGHFAIVKSVTSRYASPGITQVHEFEETDSRDTKSFSHCGKYYVWGTDYVFLSDIMPLAIEIKESIEDEIAACNRAIIGIRNEAFRHMDMALEVPKARMTELLQLQYIPKSNVPPDSEYAEELSGADVVEKNSEDALFEGHPLFNPEA